MSVFKRSGDKTYSYRFQHRGTRFSGQTGLSDKRAAEKFEDERKREIEACRIDHRAALTLNAAASRYWHERGKDTSDPAALWRQIGWLEKRLGSNMLLTDITDSDIALLMAERRGEIIRGKPLTNGAVNRSVINPLRRIINRAANVWKKPVPNIDWPRHVLPEPKELVREASPDEEAALLAAIRDDYLPPILFGFLSGCRMAEIVGLRWQDVDWFNSTFRVRGKGDKVRIVPMSEAIHELLWSLKDNHPESVFTYVARRAGNGRARGTHYPITYSGLKTAWRRYRAKSGVKNFRFHDIRHTTGTRVLRETGNLRLVQRLLGHADITTTTRYSHVLVEDLRAGLNATHSTKSGTKNGTVGRKTKTTP